MIRTPIRYPGGKNRLSKWIVGQFSEHDVYVEPFGGAASVLLNKPRSRVEVYNDIYGEVVNFFRVLRDNTAELVKVVEMTPFARSELEASIVSTSPVERARQFALRSHAGFGTDSVSHLHYKPYFRNYRGPDSTSVASEWATLPEAIRIAAERFRGVIIENKPAADILPRFDSEKTLYYVDPPYPLGLRRKDLYAFNMSDAEHRNLLDALNALKGAVVVSGFHCPLYDEALKNWRCLDREHHADGAKKITETLWIKEANNAL